MSGGTPVGGGGIIRQRHSQGYASSGDDLEDDACSRLSPGPLLPVPRARSWTEIVENILWIGSAMFVIYFGDNHSNLIYLLWHDGRVRRVPLYLGMVAIGLNLVIFFYTSMLAWSAKRFDEKWELTSISALPYVTLLGLIALCLLSFSLWPIWGFLTFPLLFTVFMACMVICPCIVIGFLRPQNDVFRIDLKV
ncbi:hypothetical protein SAY86_008141 [Trapa natans]|uniref:Transmembrane protein 128 n=1 Tax=Trapa natans TaxID=22666 RepID=A0AAN7K5V1_TRANT|nr:hypothetical protein SAY86_008141 [Trapa natans]